MVTNTYDGDGNLIDTRDDGIEPPEDTRQAALEVVEQAKNSDNPEIANLAVAFSQLLNQ